jgi:SulP family sulfate permease
VGVGSRSNLTGDLWGGFAAMLVALPAAIAFGVTIFAPLGAEYAGKGALAGMLGVTALGLIAASFGGTQRLISAPCAPAAAVLSALTFQLVQQGQAPSSIVLSLFLIALTTGLLQIGFGVLRIGNLIKYMPFQVVSGYLTGVGLIMIFGQLTKLLATPKGMPWWEAVRAPEQWQTHSLVVGIATAVSMVLAPKLTSKIPAVILGLLGGVIAYWLLAVSLVPELAKLADNRFVIGPLSADLDGLISAAASPWGSILGSPLPTPEQILLPALTLAVLLSIDTLKTCVVLDGITGSRHRSNRELIGQGLGNLAATVIGGVPGAGTMGATMVNKASGGTTFRSGIFQGLFALIAVLVLTPVIAWVPIASLAALLMVIGWRMIDWHAIELLKHKDTLLDFGIIAAVFLVASTYSLIAASGLGIALAMLMFIKEQINTSTVRRHSNGSRMFSKKVRTLEQREQLAKDGDLTSIFELQGSLFFGTTDQLFRSIEAEVGRANYLVLDFHRVQSIDLTAGHMLERIQQSLAQRNAWLVLSRVPGMLPTGRNLQSYLEEIGLTKHHRTKLFGELSDALEWIEDDRLTRITDPAEKAEELALGAFELLQDIPDALMETLAQLLQRHHFVASTPIFRRGDEGDSLMLIAKGQVKVTLETSQGQSIHITTLGRGQFFGEMSFLDSARRSADIVAIDDCVIYSLSRPQFDEAVRGREQHMVALLMRLLETFSARLRYSNEELRELREA